MGDSDVVMAPQRGNTLGTCSIEVLTLESMKDIWTPYAQEICRLQDPPLAAGARAAAPSHRAACHFQDTLPASSPANEHRGGGERLARLQAFFAARRPETGDAA